MTDTVNTSTDDLREALASNEASVRLVHTFTHGRGAQVFVGRRKASLIIFPTPDQTLADVLAMLGTLASEPAPVAWCDVCDPVATPRHPASEHNRQAVSA